MTPDEAMRIATDHHRAGRLPDAESLYRHILAAQPNEPNATYLLGLLYVQANHVPQGIELIERVVSAGVQSAEVYANLGGAYRMIARPDRAADAYRHALQIDPNPNLWTLLATSLIEAGRLEEAIPAWQSLLQLSPNSPDGWSNLGVTYERLGRLPEAEAACRRAIAANPAYAPAHNNLGAVLSAMGRLEEALAAHRAAIAVNPAFPRAYVNLAHTAQLAGRLDEALAAARKAVELTPNDPDARLNLAAALNEQGATPEAARAYDDATALLAPAVAAGDTGPARQRRSRLRLISATLLPQVYESPADVERSRTRLLDGIASLQRDGITADLTTEPAPTLFALAYQGRDDRHIAEQFASLMRPPRLELPPRPPRNRIKVGFISRFFRDHTIGRLNLGLVQHLDRSQFDVAVFSVGDHRDPTAAAYRTAADRHVILPPQLPAARQLIANESCDILLYTDLGMDPVTYSLAFSRLAPIQCTTWGHPVTTGIPTIDYFLSADALELPGSESQYTEKLVKLKHLAVYYHRPAPLAVSPTRQSFGLENTWTLYGCLQMLWKFHPDFDPLLANILRQDPNGRLLLIRGLNQTWDDQLLARFQHTLPDVVERILFLPRLPRDQFLQLTSLCDVMLDPTHFCGGNTSYESLAFHVPVITLPSPFLRGRLTHALYHQIGLTSCTATTPEDYITRAVTIATDPAIRARIRAALAERTPALYENLGAVRELESFFRSAATIL